MPTLVEVPVPVALDAELLLDYHCPPAPPYTSPNEVLVQWATHCVALAKSCARSVDRIRGLQP